MNNENYIVINGKKVEFTEEQLKQLGINVEMKKETPFTRYPEKSYWSINIFNICQNQNDCLDDFDNTTYDNVNYFNNYEFACQVALHQLLYRKLLKYAYENDAVVDDWTDPNSKKYFIVKRTNENELVTIWSVTLKNDCVVYFTSDEVAKLAIENVVKPFMEEHPEFVW